MLSLAQGPEKGLFFIEVTMLMGSDFIQINVMKVKEHKIMELW